MDKGTLKLESQKFKKLKLGSTLRLSKQFAVWKKNTVGSFSCLTLSLAHWMVCSITEGKDLRVQNGISSSGGSLWEAEEKRF